MFAVAVVALALALLRAFPTPVVMLLLALLPAILLGGAMALSGYVIGCFLGNRSPLKEFRGSLREWRARSLKHR
jgi:hypothetical protein